MEKGEAREWETAGKSNLNLHQFASLTVSLAPYDCDINN